MCKDPKKYYKAINSNFIISYFYKKKRYRCDK